MGAELIADIQSFQKRTNGAIALRRAHYAHVVMPALDDTLDVSGNGIRCIADWYTGNVQIIFWGLTWYYDWRTCGLMSITVQSTNRPASADDFATWQVHAKRLTASQLRFAISDCQRAREAMLQRDSATGQVFNQVRADFYLDQLITFKDELIERAINR